MEKHELHKLDTKLKELKDVCAEVGDGSDLEELLVILHKPGWTTPAEFAFVNTAVESLINQVRNVAAFRESLVNGARQVETGRGTAA